MSDHIFHSRRYRINPARIAMLRFLVEGYDGLLFLSTIEPKTAVVQLSWPPSCSADAEAVLTALTAELEMTVEPLLGKI